MLKRVRWLLLCSALILTCAAAISALLGTLEHSPPDDESTIWVPFFWVLGYIMLLAVPPLLLASGFRWFFHWVDELVNWVERREMGRSTRAE